MFTREGNLQQRVYSEYREMPGLCLTVWQAGRLWGLDSVEAGRILEQLERAGLLKRTPHGAYCLRSA